MWASGGEAVRRAEAAPVHRPGLLKDPPILLLDEATSALDNESELLVQRSLEELSQGRTTLTIAHRLTTIRGADVIWVLTDQGLEEHGSHEELMAKGGLYSRLYNLYASSQQTRSQEGRPASPEGQNRRKNNGTAVLGAARRSPAASIC